MNERYNLSAILEAIENINIKSKKKRFSLEPKIKKISKKNINSNENILPITEKLILEAEEYSQNLNNKSVILPISTQDVLILDKEYNDQILKTENREKIKLNIIDDLYSSLSKKVKKNTLKIIFDLREKINNLEDDIQILKTNKTNQENLEIISDIKFIQNKEHIINKDYQDEDQNLFAESTQDKLSESVINELKLKNSLIKNFKNNEEKFRLKIEDLEQNISLLHNKRINISSNPVLIKKKNDYDQLKTRTENESFFFKDNYEKLIIENNDIKKKLINAKEQIVFFEKIKIELEDALENLNDILAKNSIINLK